MVTSTHEMEIIPFNAIAKFTLKNLLNSQPEHMATLARNDMPIDLIKPFIKKNPPSSPYYAELRLRPPSTQPPAGNGHLKASLGSYIGHGHSGIVYALEDVTVSGVPSSAYTPPLVAKIARLNRVTSLMREAWFYDEMECLQGVSIARCYGYFTLDIRDDPVRADRKQVEKDFPNHDSREVNPVLDWDKKAGPLHPLLDDQSRRSDVLAILILERLGSTLPLDHPVSQETRDDLSGVYNDMAQLSVTNAADIRLPNILAAPQPCPPGLPSLPSPFSGKVHSWRAVDLEQAFKTNMHMASVRLDYECQLDNVYDEIESACNEDDDTTSSDDEV